MSRILKRPTGAAGSVKLGARTTAGRSPQAHPASPAAPAPASAVKPAVPLAPITPPPAPVPELPKAELDALRDRAYREGLAQGQQAAKKELDEALRGHAERLRAVLDKLEAAITIKLHALDDTALVVAYEATASLLGKAWSDGAGVAQVAQQLLDKAAGAVELKVQLEPALAEPVRALLQQQPQWQHRRLQVEADGTLAAGECRVASERGVLETSLALQLQGIQEAILQAHARERADKP